eukprot:4437717-Prymnesium_polylepis.1
MKEFASIGCDLCNAFKMKLMRPREKPVDNEADDAAATCDKLVMDQYGPVATKYIEGHTYILLWVAPHTPGLAFMRGCS